MTYDPNNPNRRAARDSDGMSGAAMAGIAIAVVLFLGAMVWAVSGGDRRTAAGDPPGVPPATTGQATPKAAPPANTGGGGAK